MKLVESIESEKDNSFDIKSLYGAWEDERDSDEIINEIRASRVDNPDIETFE